jgi:hypothetical protein
VDESDGLENRCGRKATVGSNPTSSAVHEVLVETPANSSLKNRPACPPPGEADTTTGPKVWSFSEMADFTGTH